MTFKERQEAFEKSMEKLCSKYELRLAAILTYTPQGISSSVKIVDVKKEEK